MVFDAADLPLFGIHIPTEKMKWDVHKRKTKRSASIDASLALKKKDERNQFGNRKAKKL